VIEGERIKCGDGPCKGNHGSFPVSNRRGCLASKLRRRRRGTRLRSPAWRSMLRAI
jgi:hypothetical protein